MKCEKRSFGGGVTTEELHEAPQTWIRFHVFMGRLYKSVYSLLAKSGWLVERQRVFSAVHLGAHRSMWAYAFADDDGNASRSGGTPKHPSSCHTHTRSKIVGGNKH